MTTRQAVSRPAVPSAKYVYKLTKHAPTTRADITSALTEALARLDVHPAPSEPPSAEDEKEPAEVPKSKKSIKKEARKEKSRKEPARKDEDPKIAPPSRNPFWFEKYLWFLSSDGYLVLTGRYPQQTALILTRHLGAHDIIVSASEPSASIVVVKNHVHASVVPPSTLTQAATLALSTSAAWDTNGLVPAWWCRESAVRITTNLEKAIAGEAEFVFKFDVDDRARIAIPAPLMAMGVGIMFVVDEESARRHARLRVDVKQDPEPDVDEPAERNAVPEDDIPEQEEDEGESDKDDSAVEDAQSDGSDTPDPPGTPARQALPRGKKSKLKKMEKYADQDEAERELRMSILSSTKPAHRAAIDAARQQQKQQRDEEAAAAREAQARLVQEQRERRQAATETQRVPVRAELLVMDEDEEREVVPRDTLIARPARDDNLLAAVPVFAPWLAMPKVKYRIKVFPGVGKRSKTLKKCHEFFIAGMGDPIDKSGRDVERCWPREVELIKQLSDAEFALPVGVAKFRALVPTLRQAMKNASRQTAPKKKKK